MRISFYSILAALLFSVLLSCSKGEMVKDPQFGLISMTSMVAGEVKIITGADTKFLANSSVINLISGQNRFRFYTNDNLLLDTSLSVEPFLQHNYVLFRPTADSNIKVYDSSLNGLNNESLPDSGEVKIGIASFSPALPAKVNISVTTSTYVSNVAEVIEIAKFVNVDKSFSPFKKVRLGKSLLPRPQYVITFNVLEPVTNTVLATNQVTLLYNASTGKILKSVYLFYLNESSKATLLMSK